MKVKVKVSEPVFIRVTGPDYLYPSFQSTVIDLFNNSFDFLQEMVENVLDDKLEKYFGGDLVISSTIEFEIDERVLLLIKDIQSKTNLNAIQSATLVILVIEVYLHNLYLMT